MSPGPADGRASGRLDCVVVGGGLAGLACAHGLAVAGRAVHVLEAGDAVGGRARSVWHEGRPVDRGFQALLRAYPETSRFLRAIGMPRRDLRPFDRGAMVHDGRRWRRFGLGPAGLPRLPGLPAGDAIRLARLAAEVALRPPEVLLAMDGPDPTAEAFLRARGLGDRAVEGLFRPLLGAILLDRTLGADPGYLRFLLAMLARGPAVLPADGMGQIAEWAAAAIRQRGGIVETDAPVDVVEDDGAGRRATGVLLADGRRLDARFVVLALDPRAARRMLEPFDPASAARVPAAAASSLTVAFALRRPLYRGRTILLNAAPERPDAARVDLVCQTTNVNRPRIVEGPHIVLAMSVTTDRETTPDGLEAAVDRLMAGWSPGFPWAAEARPIGAFAHDFAQFRPLAGARPDLPGPRTALDNVILAGDLTRHPSIEGAVSSGMRAAGIVDTLCG